MRVWAVCCSCSCQSCRLQPRTCWIAILLPRQPPLPQHAQVRGVHVDGGMGCQHMMDGWVGCQELTVGGTACCGVSR